MNGAAIAAIGGVVGTLCRMLMAAGLTGRATILGAMGVTTGAVAIWAWAHGDFSRTTSWDYFAGWTAILMSAAGTFHLIEEAPAASRSAVRMGQRLTGTGPGTIDG